MKIWPDSARACKIAVICFLHKAHIGEVHSSVWPADMIKKCRKAGIRLL